MKRNPNVMFLLAFVLAAAPLTANAAAPKSKTKISSKAKPKTGPVPAKKAVSAHAPFEMGACGVCHASANPKKPGPAKKPLIKLCYSCHEELESQMKAAKFQHAAATNSCLNCHNPHNSLMPNLLYQKMPGACTNCHSDIGAMMNSKVTHAAVNKGRSCANCHDPHGTTTEKLLTAAPYQQCLSCHSTDGVKDDAGKEMTNFKTLLAKNKFRHSPVQDEDCSACHATHGGDNFRLLSKPYPAKFYADFSVKNYELCFSCHESEASTAEKTTTATDFRDGDRNLHYLHVNKKKRGRTCRACHEVHASPQEFQIRAGVPYGSSGWVLKLNFKKTKNGGSCEKTCHKTKVYNKKKGG